jgi:hypothetical protein
MFNAQMTCKEFNMTNTTQIDRNKNIRNYVLEQYIANGGKHLFISDIAEQCKTNAKTVRAALDEHLNGFVYGEADRWSGSTFSGRYIQAWSVEPSSSLLVQTIVAARQGA